MLPRPKTLLESELSRELKGITSNGHFLLTCPVSVNEDMHVRWKESIVGSKNSIGFINNLHANSNQIAVVS